MGGEEEGEREWIGKEGERGGRGIEYRERGGNGRGEEGGKGEGRDGRPGGRAPQNFWARTATVEILEEYNYEFVYRKASSQKNADAMSRYPHADDVDSNQNADDTDVKCLDDAHCAVVRNIGQSGGQLEQPIVRTAVELGQLQRTDLDIAPLNQCDRARRKSA
jgi:hypothetical protein